jgi:hypothetical protein
VGKVARPSCMRLAKPSIIAKSELKIQMHQAFSVFFVGFA